MFIDLPREAIDNSSKDNYFELKILVKHKAAHYNPFADGEHVGLVFLGPFAFFSNCFSSSISGKEGKELKSTENALFECLN